MFSSQEPTSDILHIKNGHKIPFHYLQDLGGKKKILFLLLAPEPGSLKVFDCALQDTTKKREGEFSRILLSLAKPDSSLVREFFQIQVEKIKPDFIFIAGQDENQAFARQLVILEKDKIDGLILSNPGGESSFDETPTLHSLFYMNYHWDFSDFFQSIIDP